MCIYTLFYLTNEFLCLYNSIGQYDKDKASTADLQNKISKATWAFFNFQFYQFKNF